jgi:hypothetical protein
MLWFKIIKQIDKEIVENKLSIYLIAKIQRKN